MRSFNVENNNGNDVGLYTTAADLYLSANGVSTGQFVLKNTGSVGIGVGSPVGKVNISEATGTVQSASAGTIVLDHANAGGSSSIVFRSAINRNGDYGYVNYQDNATGSSTGGENAVLTIGTSNDPDDHIALMPSGNVGIGTTTPAFKLDVAGNGQFSGPTAIGFVNQGYYGDGANLALRPSSGGAIFLQNYAGVRTDLFIQNNGYVGIGTTGPAVKLDVRSTTTRTANDLKNGGTDAGDYANKDQGQAGVGSTYTFNVSIRSEGYVEMLGAVYYSDRRIKDIIARVETGGALKRINQLQVTDYRMVDKLLVGGGLRTGLIAQEVQAVMPEAVHQRRDFIPDVYAYAAAVAFVKTNQTLSVTMTNAHGFKVGDLVRLFDDEGQTEVKVLKVSSPTCFVVGATYQTSKLFVYGKQVDDFLSVDYDRVFTTGVAAIQELSKVTQQQAEALRKSESRIADLEQKAAKLAGIASELAEMKKLLASLAESRQAGHPAAESLAGH